MYYLKYVKIARVWKLRTHTKEEPEVEIPVRTRVPTYFYQLWSWMTSGVWQNWARDNGDATHPPQRNSDRIHCALVSAKLLRKTNFNQILWMLILLVFTNSDLELGRTGVFEVQAARPNSEFDCRGIPALTALSSAFRFRRSVLRIDQYGTEASDSRTNMAREQESSILITDDAASYCRANLTLALV